ncbi:hypothetical protein CVT24_009108 [Panaeolus cyanescens]|uniref:NADAR domain-containing protein n=1 Tax=Panaeolus cyanescens TaxID=181874 RepID=A0A409VAL1_9AGAR|nr:hypothetical protein CVT24_009108 [Panaeolus cyanescens]
MQSRKTITIVTSPPSATRSLPASLTSPITKQAPLYRIEERSRTIYVSSDDDPSTWDPQRLNKMFSEAGSPEQRSASSEPMRRAKSYVDTEFIITEESASPEETPRSPPTRARTSIYNARRPGVKSASGVPTTNFVPGTPQARLRALATQPAQRPRILFYHKHDPHYGFTNFSAHPVIYNGKKYPTSEHLFQSFKAGFPEHIRTCSERPSVAFSEARRFQPEVRPDWKQVNIEKMDEALFYKFTQHPDLLQELLATGDAELIEDSDKDAFWGVGVDRKGRNELGKCLERLRAKLRGDGC